MFNSITNQTLLNVTSLINDTQRSNMTAGLKQSKENENRAHQQLYQNVLLLTYKYPTSKEFADIFRKDMFMKNNKAAFQQVVYYLLNILNPELTKAKITAWPPYDMKLENKFRNEVLLYINQLNSVYEEANIPHVMASQLISPGAFKFVKFMLKLSQLVLVEHLKNNNFPEFEITTPIKSNKDAAITRLIIKNLKTRTSSIEQRHIERITRFNKHLEVSRGVGNKLISKQSTLNTELAKVNEELEDKKNTFQTNDVSAILNVVNGKIATLQNDMDVMKSLEQDCNQYSKLLSSLMSNDSVLEFKKSCVIFPNNVAHLIKSSRDSLELQEFFEALNVLLHNKNMDGVSLSTSELNKMFEIYSGLNEKYLHFEEKLMDRKARLREYMDLFHSNFAEKVTNQPKVTSADDDILAVPLDVPEN